MKRGVLGIIIVLTALIAVSTSVSALSSCTSLGVSDVLTANVSASGSCITLTANNIELNCQGYRITFGTSGSSSAGIIADSRNNITIRNCDIRSGNSAGSNIVGITGVTGTNVKIFNSNITVIGTTDADGVRVGDNWSINGSRILGLGTSYGKAVDSTGGIRLNLTYNTLLSNVTAATRGALYLFDADDSYIFNNSIASINGQGIYFASTSHRTNISNNAIGGTASSAINLASSGTNNVTIYNNTVVQGGSSVAGIITLGTGHVISFNDIYSNVTTPGSGLSVQSTNSRYENNKILNNGTSLTVSAIRLDGANNNFTNNNLTCPSSAGSCIGFSTNGNRFNNTIIHTWGTSNTGIALGVFSSISSQFFNTIINNSDLTAKWISSLSGSNSNFTNLTFQTSNGLLNYPSPITISGAQDISRLKVNISSNSVFVNSTNLPFLNTSAQITQLNANSSAILVDENDDGQFSVCNPPRCIRQSFSSGTLIFNVSSFTTYGPASFGGVNITLSKSDSPDPLNLSSTTILTYQINFTVNNGTAFNTTINETYPANTTFINATPSPTTGNVSWNVGNLTSGETYQINITVNVSSSLPNGTTLANNANVTFENSTGSSFLVNVTENTTVLNAVSLACGNTVTSNAALSQNYTCSGTAFTIGASNIDFNCNGYTILYDNSGSGGAYGINVSGYNNVTIRNCRIFDNTAAGDNNRGISIVTSVGSNISNVTVFTSTGTSGTAHSIYLNAAHNGSVSNSMAGMNSTSATPQGFTLQAVNSRNNTISGNTLYLNVSSIASSSFVADFITTASNNFFENNSVHSNVSVTHYAVSLQSQNTTVRYNNITVFQRDTATTAGISIAQHNQTIYGNTITVNTSSTPTMYGIDVGTSNDSTIYNNAINIRGDTGTTTGINLGSNSRQTSISGNNISSVCPSSTVCSAIDVGNSVNTTVSGNVLNATSGTTFVIDVNTANYAIINNNTIFGNATDASSHGIRYLAGSDTQGVRIINNNVTMISSNTLPYGIRLSAANLNNDCYLANNSVNVTGSTTARGISTDNIQNVTIYNSTIYAYGTSTVYGIYTDSTVGNMTINLAYIENNATDSASYALVDNDNASWSNITIFKRSDIARWLTRTSTATSNFSAITFANSNGSIKLNNFLVNYTITNAMLNITYNLSRVNSSTSSLNTTGQITLHNISTAAMAVDFNDNGTFADCSSPQCVLESFNGSTIVFNVSSFTGYSAMNLSGGGISCGSTLTSTTTLTENLTCPGTAFLIGANNVELDCDGYTISYGNNGSDSQVGVNVTGFSGVTIRNCVLVDGNASGSDGYGIRFTTVNNSIITNNIITTNGTTNNYGIRINGSVTNVNNSITNNVVNARGTTTGNRGIYIDRSYILNISQNNVSTNGTTSNDGINLYIVTNATVNDNNVSANGTSSLYGLYIYSTVNMTFYRNNVSTIGTGASFIATTDSAIENNSINGSEGGVYFETSSRTNLSRNNITSSSGYGVSYAGLGGTGNNLADSNVINTSSGILYTATQPDSNFTNNNVTVTNGGGININSNSPTIYLNNNILTMTPPVGGPYYGVDVGATNNSIINNLNLTILGNTAWMRTTLAGRTTNFTNTTLRNNNGSVFYLGTFQLENQSAVELTSLNISANRVRVNSSVVPFLNRSAQIALNNINTSTLLVDFEDDGTYQLCSASQCQLESFNGSTVVFNVSSFTSYSTSSGGVNVTLSKTDNPDPVPVGDYLNYTITFNVTGGVAYNITINETYPDNVTFVNATPSATSGNNSWNVGNLTESQSYQINITVLVDSGLTGGTILTNTINATYENSSGTPFLINVSENTTVSVPLDPPVLTNVSLFATSIQNLTSDNLTVTFNLTSPSNMNPAWNITDWRMNESSIVFFQYPFENNVSNITTSLTDYSTSNISATLGNGDSSATPNWTTSGQVGAAYDFDGTNDQINISDSRDPTVFSLEVWVKPDVVSSENIFLRTDASGPGTSWSHQLRISGSSFEAYVFDGALKTVTGNSTLAAGNWYHVVMTAEDGGNLALYVNGSQEGTNASVTTLWTGGTNYRVGSNSGGGFGFFDGIIDEVRLYNRTLTPSEISLLYNEGLAGRQPTTLHSSETELGETWSVAVTPNNHDYEGNTTLTNNLTIRTTQAPVISNLTLNATTIQNTTSDNLTAYFTVTDADGDSTTNITNWLVNGTSVMVLNLGFEGGSNASSSRDYSNFSNNITGNAGDPEFLPSGNALGFGAYEFDGVDDLLTAPHNSSLNLVNGTPMSWESFIFYNSSCSDSYPVIVAKSDTGSTSNYHLEITKASGLFSLTWYNGGYVTHSSTAAIPSGYWTHLAAVYNGSHLLNYRNGTFDNAVAQGSAPVTNTELLRVGNRAGDNDFCGKIDYVRIWNRSLSGSQIAALYNYETNLIVSNETSVGDTWQGCVTPNDKTQDGNTSCSNVLTINSDAANETIISLTKTDSPDPLNLSNTTLLNYVINFTVLNGTAYNITINETYPSNTTFVNASPTPTTGNTSWDAGNITTGTTYLINITVNVSSSLSNGTILTNTVNTTYANSTGTQLLINVSENTTVLNVVSATCPGIITSDTNLTESITAALTSQQSCVQFGADNIVLDCQGYTMTGNGSGTGINASSRSNVEVRNCNVVRFNRNIHVRSTSNSRFLSSNVTNSTDINIFFDTAGSANNFSNLAVVHNASSTDAIQFFIAGTSQLRNITMSLLGASGSGAGVYFFGSSDNSLDNLTSYAEGSSHDHVQITSTALSNNVSNIVTYNGSMLSASTSSDSIKFNNAIGTNSVISIATANNIINNVTLTGSSASQMLTTGGSSSNYSNVNISNTGGTGIIASGSTNRLINITTVGTIGMTLSGSTNVLENIQSNATGIGQNSILISGSNNNVRNVTSKAGSGIGVGVSVGSGNNISEFTVNDGYLSPISIQSGATNTIFVNGTIRSDPTCVNCDGIALSALTNAILDNITVVSPTSNLFDWISTASNSVNASISNITFQTSSGSVKSIPNSTLPVSINLNRNLLNISSNRAFLNSSNLSFLNASAQITLNNVNSNVLLVDFEDDGTYNLCNATQCVLQSFNGSTAIFNVTSFTSYSTSDFGGVNVTLSKSDSPDPLNLSNATILTYQINFTVTNGTAYNVTINETYPSNTTFINATPSPTTGNTSWNAGNITATNTYQINITVNVSSSLANGTILTNTVNTTLENSTGSSFLINVTENTTVLNTVNIQTNATLTKTDSPDPLNISNTTLLTYQINFTVTNGTAYNVTINETYSGNVTFVNSTPSPTSGNSSWNAGNVSTNYQINITVNVSNSLANGTILTNIVNATYANVTGSSFILNATQNTTILADVVNQSVVQITKTDSPDPLNISNTTILTYQINITTTNGTGYNITLTDVYPAQVSFVNSTPSPNTGNDSWIVGNLTLGQTFQVNITVNVSSSLTNGTIINNTANISYANATGSIFSANATQNTTILVDAVPSINISMTKTDAPDPVVAGQNLVYTVNINVSNGTAYNVTLSDTYPAQVSFVSASPSANASNNTWIVGNLTAGQSFQVNITVNVNSGTANGTLINNTANISYANSTGSILSLNATSQTTVSTQSFPIVINNNTNITTNGTTTGPGIIINASNVTVDCQNNIITGAGIDVGVNLTGFNNVTIQNCVFVNFATGAYVENSNEDHFTNDVFRTVTNGVNLLGTSQNSVFNHTTIAASSDWIFTSAATSGNVFQNTSYNDTGGQIIITPAVTYVANTNASQSRLDITSPEAFLNSTALPFLDVASRVTITGITNTATALILGDFDDDGTYEICSAPTCTLVSFASGTAIFDTSGWTSYTVVDSGVNFTLSKTSSPNPVTPGSNVVFTITATVNSGFAQNITVVESPPAELTFVTSTPTNISANTWLLNNLSAGQSAQINVTYAVNSSFTGTIQNNVSVTFQNSTNGTISTNVSENTTAQAQSPSSGGGGGGGGGSGSSICPPFCQYPENKDLPVCKNNCPTAQVPAPQDFGNMFPPVSEQVPVEESPEEVVVVEQKVEEPAKLPEKKKTITKKPFPWWYILIALIAVTFMIWETHHIVNKVHKPSKVDVKLDNIDKEISKLRKKLRK